MFKSYEFTYAGMPASISCKQSSFAGDAVIFQPAKENCSGKSICSVVGDRRDAGYGQ